MKKVGIIRCQQTEDICCGDTDFQVARQGKQVFKKTGPVIVVGFATCGGCPGKKAVARARAMVQSGAKTIVLASCMGMGLPDGFPCPHFGRIKKTVERALGPEVAILDWTHK